MPLEIIKSTWDVFLYAGILEYVLGEVLQPAKGDSDLLIWTKNDKLAQAGIRMNISTAERNYLRDHCTITSAHNIWTELKKHHHQKASTQTSLLDELLGICIERGADMVNAAGKVRNISKQVFEISTLDADKLALAILLRSLSPELHSIHEKYEDDDHATPADIVKSLEKEKLRCKEETKQVSAEERANAARAQKSQSGKAGSSGGGLCGTCNGPHRTYECWGKSGAMEGCNEEVLEWRVARCSAKQLDKPSTTPTAPAATKPAAKPRFAMKDSSGEMLAWCLQQQY
ncbi:hypothetical protein B0H14DRAFT_3467559 [Mycena olivaceomarginata]|nr:hypothetical protein B0H14DRAFT_3467559 [Mycena olivaceomarginata]